MPDRPLSYCVVPGCSQRVVRGRCATHTRPRDEQARPNVDVRKWYRLKRWKLLRRGVLADAAYQCAACGVITVDLQVDHIRKHDGDPALFWDGANLQALCAPCHQRKTMRGE